MHQLTQRLTSEQPVVVGGPSPSIANLRRQVEEIGYLSVKFTQTQGGTDLNMRLDQAATKFAMANLVEGRGELHIEGTLILNGDPVRCIADIDLTTLGGKGRLSAEETQEK